MRRRDGTRELRVDETYASIWRPGRATTGSVWDALALPVLALPPARRRRALILGLGGGSAARLLRALAPTIEIQGVELDADVLRAARRDFELDALGVDVVCDDARALLARTRRRFDLILDDVFVGEGEAVHKPDWLPRPGLEQAWRRLAPGGVLVSNALDEAPGVAATLRDLAPHRVRVCIEGYDNQVFAATTARLDARRLRARARAEPILADALERLRFSAS